MRRRIGLSANRKRLPTAKETRILLDCRHCVTGVLTNAFPKTPVDLSSSTDRERHLFLSLRQAHESSGGK
jgi:hypothetical protein